MLPAADHERELDARRVNLDELLRELVDGHRVEAEIGLPHQRLARELEQDPAKRRSLLRARLRRYGHQPTEYQA